MNIDLDLLKRAWPKGYLPIRGLLTRKGWQCVNADDSIRFKYAYGTLVVGWKANDPPYETYSMSDWGRHENWKAIQRGEFLPNVDPNDVATWACLLQDLAQALPAPPESNCGLYWEHWEDDHVWILGGPNDFRYAFDIQADDPGKALVLAKIQLNEKATT